MTCDPQTVVDLAKVYASPLSREEILAAVVYLLCQWANK